MTDMNEKCSNHPDNVAFSFCQSCGKYYCANCLVEGSEYYYCRREDCQLQLRQEQKNAPPTKQRRSLFFDSANKKRWQLIILASLVLAVVTRVFFPPNPSKIPRNKLDEIANYLGPPNPNLMESLVGIAGAAFGMLILAFIPASIIIAMLRLSKKEISPLRFMDIYTACWLVVALLSTLGNIRQ